MSQHHDSHHSHNGGHGGGAHHIVPFKIYFTIWIALLIGTVITVAAAYVDFGSFNFFVAMLIATVKALLVMMFFMGLKYEGPENTVTFVSSFLFLGIFVTLTAIDVFWRVPHQVAAIDKDAAAALQANAGPLDYMALSKRTPEAMARGKELFAQTCAVCHGAEGRGDGPGGVALNPKPRNFTVGDGWKNGRKISGIFKTLALGIKGGGMAAYTGLPPEDRFALSHYVQSLGPEVAADTEADFSEVKSLGLIGGESKPELRIGVAVAKYAPRSGGDHKPTAYQYEQGQGFVAKGLQSEPQSNVPRDTYCSLPAQYRPRYCP
jgi:cytochrome c oxidase subunit 4